MLDGVRNEDGGVHVYSGVLDHRVDDVLGAGGVHSGVHWLVVGSGLHVVEGEGGGGGGGAGLLLPPKFQVG